MSLSGIDLEIATPRWALPLLHPKPYKGAKGGRASGKSHFFAEMLIEDCVADKDLPCVCIREIQRSLKFSVKRLLEGKIKKLGVGHLFDIQEAQIKRRGGDGIIIFQGMQDHTADSIKSLEAFKRAWVDEAQSLSSRSIELLVPTILRTEGAELWASWNPNQPEDAVEQLFNGLLPDEHTLVHVNYTDNPFLTEQGFELAERWKQRDPETFGHVWLGQYNKKNKAQILNGKWVVDEFTPNSAWNGPYFGADWGFAEDPTTLIKLWEFDGTLYVEQEVYEQGLEIKDTADKFRMVPGAERYTIRADNSRPETISHIRGEGLNIEAAQKWPGSVEDGITYLRSFKRIVIHPQCPHTAEEARLYSYKVDKNTGDILPDIIDKNNHCWDAIRYALGPMIKKSDQGGFIVL